VAILCNVNEQSEMDRVEAAAIKDKNGR